MAETVQATFWYLKRLPIWNSTKPYFINVPQSALQEDQKSSNEISEPIADIPVRNMRDLPWPNDIDLRGFAFHVHEFGIREEVFRDPSGVRREYIPKVETWLKMVTGAEIVHTLTSEVCPSLIWPTRV